MKTSNGSSLLGALAVVGLMAVGLPTPANASPQRDAAASPSAATSERAGAPAPVLLAQATASSEEDRASDKESDASKAEDKEPERKRPEISDAVIVEPAAAPPRGRKLQLRYSSLSVLRVNPLGAISDNLIGGRYRLYDSDNALLKDNYIGLAIAPTISGGFIRGGFLAELQPVSVMRLWARVDVLNFFGIFNIFQSFEDPASDYSDSKLSELGALDPSDPKRNYSTWGTQVTAGLDLKIKFGPVAARSLSRVIRSEFQMRQGDRVYFDQLYDVLAPNGGFVVTNDTDLLGYFDLSFLDIFQGMRVVGGVRNTVTAALYSDAHFAPGNPDRNSDDLFRRTFADNGPIWRVGPLISLTLFDHPGALFNKPTIFMAAQWHILHRWRTDADVSRLIPYTFVGLAFSGDFLS